MVLELFLKITDSQLKPLLVSKLTAYEQKHDVANIAIHRGELQKILAKEIGIENICLIGDAAHSATPNLAQGASQAIEDAYVIGQLLDKGVSIEILFHNTKR